MTDTDSDDDEFEILSELVPAPPLALAASDAVSDGPGDAQDDTLLSPRELLAVKPRTLGTGGGCLVVVALFAGIVWLSTKAEDPGNAARVLLPILVVVLGGASAIRWIQRSRLIREAMEATSDRRERVLSLLSVRSPFLMQGEGGYVMGLAARGGHSNPPGRASAAISLAWICCQGKLTVKGISALVAALDDPSWLVRVAAQWSLIHAMKRSNKLAALVDRESNAVSDAGYERLRELMSAVGALMPGRADAWARR